MKDVKLKDVERNIQGRVPFEVSSKPSLFQPIIALIFLPVLLVFYRADLPVILKVHVLLSTLIGIVVTVFMIIYSVQVVIVGEIVTLKTLFGEKREYSIFQITKTKVFRLRGRSLSILTIENADGKTFRQLAQNSEGLFTRQVPAGDVIDFVKEILSRPKE